MCDISIHAPREGGDFLLTYGSAAICDFNPRPPARGATQVTGLDTMGNEIFQSTPPREGGDIWWLI